MQRATSSASCSSSLRGMFQQLAVAGTHTTTTTTTTQSGLMMIDASPRRAYHFAGPPIKRPSYLAKTTNHHGGEQDRVNPTPSPVMPAPHYASQQYPVFPPHHNPHYHTVYPPVVAPPPHPHPTSLYRHEPYLYRPAPASASTTTTTSTTPNASAPAPKYPTPNTTTTTSSSKPQSKRSETLPSSTSSTSSASSSVGTKSGGSNVDTPSSSASQKQKSGTPLRAGAKNEELLNSATVQLLVALSRRVFPAEKVKAALGRMGVSERVVAAAGRGWLGIIIDVMPLLFSFILIPEGLRRAQAISLRHRIADGHPPLAAGTPPPPSSPKKSTKSTNDDKDDGSKKN